MVESAGGSRSREKGLVRTLTLHRLARRQSARGLSNSYGSWRCLGVSAEQWERNVSVRNRLSSGHLPRSIVILGVIASLMVLTVGLASAKPSGSGPGNSPNAKVCRDWQDLYKSDGSGFASRDDCVSYAAEGGTVHADNPLCDDWAELFDSLGQQFDSREECEAYVDGGGVLYPDNSHVLINQVTVDPPSPTAGIYDASWAQFGPAVSATGVSGSLVLIFDSGGGSNSDGCEPLIGFPAGAIALVAGGGCTFVEKAENAQAAGAVAVVVVNDAAGEPVIMPGPGELVTVPVVMVSLSDGATIMAGLPSTGTVSAKP